MWVTAAIRTSTSDSVGEDKSVWVIVKDKERLPERQPFMSLTMTNFSSPPLHFSVLQKKKKKIR